jgi:hypothetical protein
MKKLKVSLGMMAIILVSLTVFSCKDTKKSDDQKDDNHMEINDGTMNHQDTQNDKMMAEDQKTSKVTAILDNYLQLKNALVADNTELAATAGKTLLEDLAKFDQSSIAEAQKQEVIDIVEDAREHAEHISENSGKMNHQREHFEILSNDVKDLIAITGTDRVLYKTYCPMYNEGKGGIWLSETKEIKNPYYGSKMMKCGEIQEEIK